MFSRVEVPPAILGNKLKAKYWSGWLATAESIQDPYRPTGKLGEALKIFEEEYLQPGWEYVTAGRQMIDGERSPANGSLSGLQLVYTHSEGVRMFSLNRGILGVKVRSLNEDYRLLAFKPEVVERMRDEGPGRFFVDPESMNDPLEGTNAYIKRINAGFNMVIDNEAEMRALQDSPFKDFGFMQEGVLRVDLVIKHHENEAYRHEGRLDDYTRQLVEDSGNSMIKIFLSGAKKDVAQTRALIVANPIPLL